MKYRVIVSDPPWPSRDRLPGPGRGAAKKYKLMSASDIRDYLPMLEMGQAELVADNAVLFLWRIPSMGDLPFITADAWGFTPKAEIVWKKMTVNGKRHFGMGSYVRMEHESCIIAIRGSCRPKIFNQRSIFEAPVGPHSTKPEEFYKIVEAMYDGPYLELFARKRRPGWDAVGDEL